jgi:hypothetical protein
MPAIKVHLEDEEFAPIYRLAEYLHLTPEDVVYAGLNQLMLRAAEPETQTDIGLTRQWRSTDLPLWSDSARSVHAYEGKPDEHSLPRY